MANSCLFAQRFAYDWGKGCSKGDAEELRKYYNCPSKWNNEMLFMLKIIISLINFIVWYYYDYY